MPRPRETVQRTQERILQAAVARFREYGYGKTTMAEIAQDCEMSAANLYRYFDNKRDIEAALAGQCLGDKEAVLREILEREGLSASERLSAFVLEGLRYAHAQWTATPRINELVDNVTRQRHDLVGQHMKARRAMLVKIVEEGNAAGEFRVENPTRTADAVLSATFLFDYPNVMQLFPLEVFEGKARDVCRVLIDGLRPGRIYSK